MKTYEIRDPVHGFIELNEWERQIVDHPVFQRLRRIRQLGLTDMVYPGAMHSRFEHSLGVMHVATLMFDQIVKRRQDFLERELAFRQAGLDRDRILVRLTALLHDVGHSPFSHAGEDLMVTDTATNKPFKHEHYSGAAIVFLMGDAIENHPLNQNYGIKAQDIADLLNGHPNLGRRLLWKDLLSSQLDADRADYLLRDSHHIGVAYGNYDLQRLLVTLSVAIDPETDSPKVVVESGGIHAAEGLILARYMMFTQVYFQHTRRAYDFHCSRAIKCMLPQSQRGAELERPDAFPPPDTEEGVRQYLKWDDWKVLAGIGNGQCGDDGQIITERRHHRRIYETMEMPDLNELELAEEITLELGNDVAFVDTAEKSWYNSKAGEIQILMEESHGREEVLPLSVISGVVSGLKPVNQLRVYVPMDTQRRCKATVEGIVKEWRRKNGTQSEHPVE